MDRAVARSSSSSRCRSGERRGRRALHAQRERRRVAVFGRRRVRLQRDHRLQLRVQHRQRRERVEADPRPGRDRREQASRDRLIRGARLPHQRRRFRRHEPCGARERLRRDGLRHPREPRRAAARVRERVLPPDAAAALVDATRDERVRQALRASDVACRDARVERAEVRERMELEAASREVAVDDAVCVGDVGLRLRRPVLEEEVVVRLQLADQRERARLGHLACERCELLERYSDMLAPAARQHTREICGATDLSAATLLRRRCDASGRERLQC